MLKKLNWLFVVLFLGFSGYAEAATATYKVGPNDSLSKIALRFLGDAEKYPCLAVANNIQDANIIRPGQIIRIECHEDAPATATVQETVVVTASVVTTPAQSARNDEPIIDTLVFGPAPVKQVTRSTIKRSSRRKSQKEILTARAQSVAHRVVEVFGPQVAPKMLEIWTGESGLVLNRVGYNCHYWTWKGRVSRACEPEDIGKHWSVDCGIPQINWRGKSCPPHLLTLEGSLAAAKRLYDERGFQPWVVYQQGKHQPFVGMYNWVSALSTPQIVDTFRLVGTN